MRVYGHKWVTDSLASKEVDIGSYDLVAYFKLLTQNDQSFFHQKSDETTNLNTKEMGLAEKMEHCMKMESGQMNVLSGVFVHIYDASLRDEAQALCDIMEASTTGSIVPFLTTHIVVDKITPIFKPYWFPINIVVKQFTFYR